MVFAFGFLSKGWPSGSWTLAVIQALCLSLPLGLLGYGINDIFDEESDRLNPEKNPLIEGGAVTSADRGLITRGAAVAALLLLAISFATGNLVNIGATAGLVVLTVIYSAPPLRLKEIPLLDCTTSALGYLVLPYVIGYSHHGSALEAMTYSFALTALCVAATHAYASIRDIPADTAAGIRTTGTWLGPRTTGVLAAAVFTLAATWGRFRSDAVPLFLGLCAVVSVITALVPVRLSPKAARWGLRSFGVAFFLMAGGYLWATFA